MDDLGVSENIGSILMIFVLVVLAGVVMVYAMDIGGASAIAGYHPQYAIVNAEVIPGLSDEGIWDANSIKIKFIAGNELDLEYEEYDWSYSGTKGIKFMLIDPNGGSHEALQSVTMKGQGISPGAVFYYFKVSPGIDVKYYITNDYSRIGDKSKWGGGWSNLQPFADGTWRVQIIDDNMGIIIADKEVVV